MRTQTHLSRAVTGSAANTRAALSPAKHRNLLQDNPSTGTQPLPPSKEPVSRVSEYLTALPRSLSGSINRTASNPVSGNTESEVAAKIDALAKKAREDLSSPLVRLPALCDAFGLARSTALKKVARKELPQRVYFDNSRITAYRKVDIDMTLAANALAARHGYVLNFAAFIAAISAPLDTTARTN